MAPRLKQDYSALIAEHDDRLAKGETRTAIKADFKSRGVHWGTFDNHHRDAKKKAPRETAMSVDEAPVEVLPGQMSIEDTDTVAEVHYDAVNEFDALPEGYAKVIQPMRPYSDAEEWALDKSMELYSFIGAIVRDQYGRILDGHHRQKVARLRGLGVPHTVTHVNDDAHAMEIARALNAVRRQYTVEQRQELAILLRQQEFSYREIAVALGVSKDTVQRDIFGAYQVVPAPEPEAEIVSHETVSSDNGDIVSHETPTPSVTESPAESVSHATILLTEPPTPAKRPDLPQRIQRKGGGTYPAQRPTGDRPKTSPADRQLAQVINLLMSHAQQWSDQHWQAFLEVVQNLRGSQAATPATE